MISTMMDVPLSLNHLLDRAGTIFPGGQIVSRLPDKSLRRHSYAQYHRRTRALGSALQTLGLRKGERVATLCWNHHAHLEAYFGIPAAGGVMHTLNLRLSPEEIGWIAGNAKDRFLIVDDILLPLYRQFASLHAFEKVIVFPFSGAPVPDGFVDYEVLLADADPDAFEYAAHAETDPISMCYTSGTTGRAKGVVYSHRSTVLHTLVASLGDYAGLRSTDTVLPVTPMFHANCWGIPYAALMVGAKLVFPGPHLHPEDLLDLMRLEPPTLSLGVPTIWMSLIQLYERGLTEQPGRWVLPQGMRSLVGGAAVPDALIRAFARHGVWLLQAWGMTETSPVATFSYLRGELKDAGDEERYRRAAMAGVPVPLVDLRIRSEDGHDAPWDGKAMGEVQVRGPYITGSYHQVPVSEDKFTADGWLRTGDLGFMDERGYFRITDRKKDIIVVSGFKVFPNQIEDVVALHPGVAEVAAIGVRDDKSGEVVKIVVLKKDPALTEQALLEHCRQHLTGYKMPKIVEFRSEPLPKSNIGKILRRELRHAAAPANAASPPVASY